VSAEVLPGGVGWGEAAGLVAGAGALAAIPLRHRWPVAFTAVAGLVASVAPLAAYTGLVGLYTTATLRRWPMVLATTAFTLLVALAELWSAAPAEFRSVAGYTAAVVVSCAAVGLSVGARRALLASLRERAERAEAEQARRAEQARTAERRRIAREMHDALGHRLSLLSVHAGALELRADLGRDAVAEAARVLRETARGALDDLRDVVLVLREAPLDDADRPQPRLDDVGALVAQSRAAGTAVELVQRVDAVPPEQVGRTAYRVVQEGLTNARRHAAGAPVRVEVRGAPGDGLVVRVVNGPGRAGTPGAGTGLIGLGERVALVGGALDHGPAPDGGHVLAARLPWG
jgi:signal transduction histidine kinase